MSLERASPGHLSYLLSLCSGNPAVPTHSNLGPLSEDALDAPERPPLGGGNRNSETDPSGHATGEGPAGTAVPSDASYQGEVIRVDPDDAQIRIVRVILGHGLECL